MHISAFLLSFVLLIVSGVQVRAQGADPVLPPGVSENATAEDGKSTRWAIIIVGLPGDEDHARQFAATTQAWRDWLTTRLNFADDHVIICQGPVPDEPLKTRAATRDSIAEQCRSLSAQLKSEDGLWLFVLGHGDFDGTAAHVHLPGPDPDAADFAEWLAPFRCREQVLWLTHCCSGYWLPRLSRPGRIVLTATAADAEVNETEFPHALATVVQRTPQELDVNADQQVSLAELIASVTTETLRRFESDQRLPTEHAQLDDNGDAKGIELKVTGRGDKEPLNTDVNAESTKTDPRIEPNAPPLPGPPAAGIPPDGDLSRKILLPYRPESWKPREEPAVPPAPPSTLETPNSGK